MPLGARESAEVATKDEGQFLPGPRPGGRAKLRLVSDEPETLPLIAAAWLKTTREFPVRNTIAKHAHTVKTEDPRARAAIQILARLAEGNDLELGDPIGEGGMSVVRLGRQTALGREVAVKALRPSEAASEQEATLHMLREAWVTGALEHPNVVPVHDISLDATGKPRIVLKRIAGSPWRDLIQEQSLEANVRTLMQVCNAVHFAHSRGVIHRDLKSDNVMIGEFGEVYVLDWGLAVSLRDDGSGRFPLASEIEGISGTPAYMAPEMLHGRGELLSERTDVYLLGGLLYEVLTGWPPHMGTTINIVMEKIARASPEIPTHVPVDLRPILTKALAKDPANRYASADELRSALGDFLEHRSSTELAHLAGKQLAELEKIIGEPRSSSAAFAEERRLRAYKSFGECRFGFLQAIAAWSENDVARNGLRRAVTFMVELELNEGDPRTAQMLMSELEDPPSYIAERVAAAAKARREKDKRLASIARDLDPRVGRRVRLWLSVILGVIWTLLPWVGFLMEKDDPSADQVWPLISSSSMFILAAAAAFWFRESLSRTAINRALVRSVGIVLFAQIALFAITLRLHVSYEATRVLVLLLYAACSAMTAAMAERRLWPTPLAYFFVATVATIWPMAAWPVESIANLALTINVLFVWWRDDAKLAKGVLRSGA
jgi:eukaryotic-like serine/threonine-protein kinase